MKYNKLVRDRIPEIVKKNGESPITHTADDDEYWLKLKEKLREEAEEFAKDGNEEEMADILEVLRAIAEFKKVDMKQLERLRKKKADERGGFGKRIILDETR